MDAARQIGLFDAHCHPTDMMTETSNISNMKARALTVMATRSQDQELVVRLANTYPLQNQSDLTGHPDKRYVIPSFGWHPWFAHQMYDDRDGSAIPGKREHYRAVLSPTPKDDEQDNAFLDSLPDPRSLREFLKQTEERLSRYPLALVGEIGLDRSFRVPVAPFQCPQDLPSKDTKMTTDTDPEIAKDSEDLQENVAKYTPGSREGRSLTPFHVKMDHQKVVLKAQLELAGKHQRAVSIHSVATHGIVFDVLQSLWKGHEKPSKSALKRQKRDAENEAHEKGDKSFTTTADATNLKTHDGPLPPLPYPPRICLHSYSGPAESLTQFLNPRIPANIFFSFSELVNFGSHESDKVVELIRRMPQEKVLIESDLHRAGDMMDDLLEGVLSKVCKIKGWELGEGAETCRTNWEGFVFGNGHEM